jgi:hypothetical protein
VPDTIPEESFRKHETSSPYESVHSLKTMIDRLVEESKVENESVQARLRDIQRKHQEVLNDLSAGESKHTTLRPTALPEYPNVDRNLVTAEDGYSNLQEHQKQIKTDIEGGRLSAGQKQADFARQRTQPKRSKESESIPLEYTDEPDNETLDMNWRREIPLDDSFATLNSLEGRIIDEIITLRETKVKLMKTVNQ